MTLPNLPLGQQKNAEPLDNADFWLKLGSNQFWICQRCGSLVMEELIDKHNWWHDQVRNP